MSNEDFARNPKTPPEALAMLSTSPSAEVRRLVALNPSTPVPALRFLAADEDRAVREAVATNPMTPYDAFAAKEAPPAPVAEPMMDNLGSADFITDEPEEVPVQDAAPPEPAVVPAQFVPAGDLPKPRSLWQRFLALFGLGTR